MANSIPGLPQVTSNTVQLPIFTDSVNQNFFIESLNGPWNQQNYLNRFPDTVYSKGIDTSLVKLLYALLGPAGAGSLRQEYLEARLQLEEAAVSGADLDNLYTSPFAFARLAEETYDIDAQASLLPSDQRAQILAADSAFRNRAFAYFKAIRAGGTVLGLRLAAESGLNHPVDVIENYKALYDQFADIPLGIPYVGASVSLNEVIIVPRNDAPTSAQQTFVLTGEPTSGFFSITVPLGAPYNFISPCSSTSTASNNVLNVPNPQQFAFGAFVTLAPITSFSPLTYDLSHALYAEVNAQATGNQVTLVYPPDDAHAPNTPFPLPASTNYVACVGNAQTVPIPYDATFDQIQAALGSLPVVGNNNIVVSGGPLPDQNVVVSFTNELADVPVGELQINVGSDIIGGIGINPNTPEMLNAENQPVIAFAVTVDQVGVSADSQNVTFAPGDVQAMLFATDILRPATSFITTNIGRATTHRQPANNVFAGSQYTETLRYTTGRVNVAWPKLNNINWIQGGVEHEKPTNVNNYQPRYVNFHNLATIITYTGEALTDPHYLDPENATIQPFYAGYFNTHIGIFNQAQQTLYPFFQQYQNAAFQFSPAYAAVTQPDRPLMTSVLDDTDNTAVLANGYPASYLNLPGIQQQPLPAGQFWSSIERTDGTEYVEIDLGSVQAVNYLYFEATNKPFTIDIAYDLLDQAPQRVFQAATIVPSANGPTVMSLTFDSANTNPWTPITLQLSNALGQMLYTRFIRIGFTRNASTTPFVLGPNGQSTNTELRIPYSVEVRNLRIGRNVATDGSGNQVAVPFTPVSFAPPLAGFSYDQVSTSNLFNFDGAASGPNPEFAGADTTVIVSYSWDFGDGGTGTGLNPAHTYSIPGYYNVTLTVTNSIGVQSSTTKTITYSPGLYPAPSLFPAPSIFPLPPPKPSG